MSWWRWRGVFNDRVDAECDGVDLSETLRSAQRPQRFERAGRHRVRSRFVERGFLFVRQSQTDAVKVLLWDGTGLCIYNKRFEEGRFARLWGEPADLALELTSSKLVLFLEGCELVGKQTLSPSEFVPRFGGRGVIKLAHQDRRRQRATAPGRGDCRTARAYRGDVGRKRKTPRRKTGRLQQELREIKQHHEKLQKMQFGASSEKRERDEKRRTRRRRKKRRRSGPTPQPDLDKRVEWFELDEPDQICPECGDSFEQMGDLAEESEMIDVVERTFVVKQVRRHKYTCRCCGLIEAALGPKKLRGTRRYSPEFALEVATYKYLDHLPLARQARRMGLQGLNVTSQTLWDQLDKLADHVETTYLGIKHWIFGADIVGMDETTWRLMKKGRTKKWQMWAIRGRGAMWFARRDSRSGNTAAKLLEGYDGWLITDGYEGYKKAVRQVDGTIRQAGCCTFQTSRTILDANSSTPNPTTRRGTGSDRETLRRRSPGPGSR